MYEQTNYLMHHGILGMKWGIRRYQNYDGTLTAEGRERYRNDSASQKAFAEEYKIPAGAQRKNADPKDPRVNDAIKGMEQKYKSALRDTYVDTVMVSFDFINARNLTNGNDPTESEFEEWFNSTDNPRVVSIRNQEATINQDMSKALDDYVNAFMGQYASMPASAYSNKFSVGDGFKLQVMEAVQASAFKNAEEEALKRIIFGQNK